MAWVSWKRMAFSKKQGGLGFRDLNDFNSALLRKQAWRIQNSPNSLLYKILKSWYFSNDEFVNASAGSKPSYGWTSILRGLNPINKGLCWLIGKGNIKAYVDKWIPCHPPRAATNVNENQNLMVKDLWTNKQWDGDKLNGLTNKDVNEIRKIYIPQHPREDKLIWHYTKDGNYTVKSGYWLTSQDRETFLQPPSGNLEIKTKIWSTAGPKTEILSLASSITSTWNCLLPFQ